MEELFSCKSITYSVIEKWDSVFTQNVKFS